MNRTPSFDYYQPTEIRFGWGRTDEMGEVAASFGEKALLVTGSSSQAKFPLYKRIKKDLKEQGLETVHFDGVVSNPNTESIDRGVEIARQENVDMVLGVGGGSSMDTAKAIAVGATHEGRAWDYRLFTDKEITEDVLPIITLTTTAGTGSQVTPVSVVTNEEEKLKFALADDLLCPDVSIVDPEVTLTVPGHVTASTGFDVFAHAFESYIHQDASPYTDLQARESLRLVAKYLPRVVEDGSDEEARYWMSWADTLAGYCIANSGTTLPHGMGMAIGGHATDVMHGEALAAVYPQFTRYTYESAREKFARLGRIFRPELKEEPEQAAAEKTLEIIDEFLKEIGMWNDLEGLGVEKGELQAIAEDSVKLPDYQVNPRVPDKGEILELLEASYRR